MSATSITLTPAFLPCPRRRSAPRREATLPASRAAAPLRDTAPVSRPRASRLRVDPEILAGCRRGEAEAFDALFTVAGDRVFTLALHLSGDEATAADVTQDVFLKLLDRFEQFRGDSAFSTWLYRVVVNTFLDQRRARRPWLSLPESGDEEAVPPELLLPPTQEEDASRRQKARAVQAAVAELGPRFRVLVVLRYSAGLSYEEIAEVLDVSPGTVASRLNRAHSKLARKLAAWRDRTAANPASRRGKP